MYNRIFGAGLSHTDFRRMWQEVLGPLEKDALLAVLLNGELI